MPSHISLAQSIMEFLDCSLLSSILHPEFTHVPDDRDHRLTAPHLLSGSAGGKKMTEEEVALTEATPHSPAYNPHTSTGPWPFSRGSRDAKPHSSAQRSVGWKSVELLIHANVTPTCTLETTTYYTKKIEERERKKRRNGFDVGEPEK